MDLQKEFSRQVNNLIDKGYPKLSGMTDKEFANLLAPLSTMLKDQAVPEIDLEQGKLPFVIVIKNDFLPVIQMMHLAQKNNKEGIVKLFPLEPTDFLPISEVTIPENPAYLLVDIDRGKANINLPPEEAMVQIKAKNRSPLTIDEGIAIVTQFPEFLMKNNCFSLLASRHTGDKRVPAIWINANKNPNLGWCWNGNPHTWLGSASCLKRI